MSDDYDYDVVLPEDSLKVIAGFHNEPTVCLRFEMPATTRIYIGVVDPGFSVLMG